MTFSEMYSTCKADLSLLQSQAVRNIFYFVLSRSRQVGSKRVEKAAKQLSDVFRFLGASFVLHLDMEENL